MSEIPTVGDLEETKEYMDNINEFESSENDTFTDRDDKTRLTVTGVINKVDTDVQEKLDSLDSRFDEQLEGQQESFEAQSNANQSTFEIQLASIGYQVIGNFTDGCTVTSRSDAVYYAGNALNSNANEGFYAWNSTFPKTVTAGDTPFDEPGWLLAATGYVKQSGAIQLFGQTIDVDIAIPSGQNALSINPTISDGVTVTVPEGSEYIILGSTL